MKNRTVKRDTVNCAFIWFMCIFTCVYALTTTRPAKPAHNYYARGAVVIDLDRENDVVVVEDCVGYTWEFTECEDWFIGDGCVMVMDDMGTETIFDDEIVNVHYERFDLLNNEKG